MSSLLCYDEFCDQSGDGSPSAHRSRVANCQASKVTGWQRSSVGTVHAPRRNRLERSRAERAERSLATDTADVTATMSACSMLTGGPIRTSCMRSGDEYIVKAPCYRSVLRCGGLLSRRYVRFVSARSLSTVRVGLISAKRFPCFRAA